VRVQHPNLRTTHAAQDDDRLGGGEDLERLRVDADPCTWEDVTKLAFTVEELVSVQFWTRNWKRVGLRGFLRAA
jgi:hypothetical protein